MIQVYIFSCNPWTFKWTCTGQERRICLVYTKSRDTFMESKIPFVRVYESPDSHVVVVALLYRHSIETCMTTFMQRGYAPSFAVAVAISSLLPFWEVMPSLLSSFLLLSQTVQFLSCSPLVLLLFHPPFSSFHSFSSHQFPLTSQSTSVSHQNPFIGLVILLILFLLSPFLIASLRFLLISTSSDSTTLVGRVGRYC